MHYIFPISTICIIFLASCTNTGSEGNRSAGSDRQIALEEVLRLGDESQGDTILFGSVTRIVVNGRGDIFVAEERSWILHAFRADGAYLSQVGAQGEGPGEYQYNFGGAAIGPADSVYLWVSWPHTRIQIYDSEDFSFTRSVQVHKEETDQRNLYPLIGATEDGWIMTIGFPNLMDGDDGFAINNDTDRELILVSREGVLGSGLADPVSDDEEIWHIYEDSGGITYRRVPFGRSTTWRIGDDELLYYGWNDSIEINFVSVDGSTRGVIRHKFDPVPITEAEITEARRTDDPVWKDLYAAHAKHETKPAFQTFAVDEMGRVWVKLSSAEGADQAEWLILDRESRLVGTTTLPLSVNLEVVQGGYAYGIIEEQDGFAPMVVVYEITE
ncbi:MAG: 6-bladed beta-propeller [Bacteroidetes bacterium]|nr:6-bladed beta-propeller [Bacteroidota bacterium]